MPKQLFQRPAPIKKSKMGKHDSSPYGQAIPQSKADLIAKINAKKEKSKKESE